MNAVLLAAGFGSRLMPITATLAKCMVPILGMPLLAHWLMICESLGIRNIVVNTHHLADQVQNFIKTSRYKNCVDIQYEVCLSGTAGTLLRNAYKFNLKPTLVAHADNWCVCDFHEFVSTHQKNAREGYEITMMTFRAKNPEQCGIVVVDDHDVVTKFYEKKKNPPGNLANAAIYILEPSVFEWIKNNPHVTDFSEDVIPRFLGKIKSWENSGLLVDIGTPEALKSIQENPYCKKL
jgi:mannose-1-phosphate guanylyltransferase